MLTLIFKEFGLGLKRSYFGAFLFLSSMYTVFITTVQSQLEIVILFLMLLGIYYYIKDDMKKFVLFFALSVPLKMVSIFVFIPLLLLKQKNILKIILSVLVSVSLLAVGKIVYASSAAYAMLSGTNSKFSLGGLSYMLIQIGTRRLSVFAFAFICLCILCFAKKLENKAESIYLTSYVSLLATGALTILFPCSSYWLALIVPFMVMVTMANKKSLCVNMMLDVGISVGWMVYCFTSAAAFTNLVRTGREFLLMKAFAPTQGEEYTYKGVGDFLISHDLDQYTILFYALMIACFAMFCIINFPYKKQEIGNEQPIDRAAIWIRLLAVICSVGFVFYIGIAKNQKPLVDSTTQKSEVLDTAFSVDRSGLSQSFTADRDFTATQLILMFDTENIRRSSVNMMCVSLCDENGKVLAEDTMGLYVLPDCKNVSFEFSDVELKKGEKYTVQLTLKYDNPSQNYGTAKVFVSQKPISNYEPCVMNGEKQNVSLYMNLI